MVLWYLGWCATCSVNVCGWRSCPSPLSRSARLLPVMDPVFQPSQLPSPQVGSGLKQDKRTVSPCNDYAQACKRGCDICGGRHGSTTTTVRRLRHSHGLLLRQLLCRAPLPFRRQQRETLGGWTAHTTVSVLRCLSETVPLLHGHLGASACASLQNDKPDQAIG